MTASTVSPAPVASAALTAATRQPPVLPNLLRSEWAKVRSVRSTYWSLAAAVAAMIGYGAINSAPHAGAGHGTSDPILTSLSGVLLAQLAIGVLGVLVITTEYSTGMIRSTFAAAPQRHLVIIAKAGVLGAAAFAVGTVASLIAFLAGQAIMGANGVSLTSPGALRSVIGIGLYLGLLGVFAVAPRLAPGHNRQVPARQRRASHLHHRPRHLHPVPLGRPGRIRPLRRRRSGPRPGPPPPPRRLTPATANGRYSDARPANGTARSAAPTRRTRPVKARLLAGLRPDGYWK
jgi:hypothetical protein